MRAGNPSVGVRKLYAVQSARFLNAGQEVVGCEVRLAKVAAGGDV